MLLSELQTKDIVNLSDGNKIGKIKDIDIDVQTGDVVSINVLTVSKLRSFFSGTKFRVHSSIPVHLRTRAQPSSG